MEEHRFKVNLGGMIEILSDHLYSSPDVYVRELLQNAVDAITARKLLLSGSGEEKEEFEGSVILDIEEGKELTFADNGQGLTREEIHQFLAIIGESSKRDPENGRVQSDYIGRFGIGLLSCFMVSDEIKMITRSCRTEHTPALEWCGKPDGTYTIREITEPEAFIGTKVILKAKPGAEDYFTGEVLERLITYYGLLLPFPVTIRQNGEEKQINPVYLPWDGRGASKPELMLFGQRMFGEQFFDCVVLHSETGNVSGAAYILNYPVLPSAKQNHRIYLKNMLLTEKGDNLIPDWAVFTRCIINASDLRPTASREGFYADGVLEQARIDIEDSLITYIAELAEHQNEQFHKFFRMHKLTLMSLALASEKLFKLLIDYFEFETTRGVMTGLQLRISGEPLVYAPAEDKYKQLSQLFFAQDRLLINVSYVHSLDLLLRLGSFFGIMVSAVEEGEIEDLMRDLSVEDQEESFDFLNIANRVLKDCDCRAELKYYSPHQQPAFYLLDDSIVLKRRIVSVREQADSMFFNMLDALAEDISAKTASVLYFNYHNPIIRRLAGITDEKTIRLFVEILYVQALQIGGFTLHHNELSMMNRNILELMERGLTDV